jgi:hypothetical protein
VRVLVTITPADVQGGYRVVLAARPPRLRGEDRRPARRRGGAEGLLPHLLVRNDTDGLEEAGVLAGIPCRVEVLYSDGMDAKVIVDGWVEEVRDMSTQELLRVADRAASMAR